MGPAIAALGRSLAALTTRTTMLNNAMSKYSTALSNFNQNSGGALTGFLDGAKNVLKDAASLWKDYNDQAYKNVRQIGLAVTDVQGYQKSMMVDMKHLTAQYGITIDQLLKQQQSVSDSTQKARLLGEQDLKNLSAMNKLIGENATNEAIRNLDRLGGSLDTATVNMAKTWAMARRYGLNAQQASDTFAKNIKMAESYTFANGIQGIAKMTLLSQKLKFDMEGVAKAAESNFGSVESAIESSAKLQMLGGNMGAMFNNPMDALYESINDIEGFTERVIAGASQRGRFNAKTGMFEMGGLDRMFLKEQAKALGMSFEDLFQMASQSVTNKQIESQLRGNFTEEQKAYVTSNAQYDTEKQKHYITKFNPETEKMERVYVDNLTSSLVAQMQDMAAPEQVMQNDVADIKHMLMDYFHTTAHDLVSLRERETGIKEGLATASAEGTHKAMTFYQDDVVNRFADSDAYKWLLDHPVATLLGGTLLGGLGVGGSMYKRYRQGGNTPSPSGGNPVSRSWNSIKTKTKAAFSRIIGGNSVAVEAPVLTTQAERIEELYGDKGAAAAGKQAAKTSIWSKAWNGAKNIGSKAKGLWKGLGKGGKAGVILADAALIGSLFGGGGGDEEPEVREEGPGTPIEGGENVLIELQKHTALLEKIAGANAEALHEAKYGKASHKVGEQEYGLLDKTMDTANMATLPMMIGSSIATKISPKYAAAQRASNIKNISRISKLGTKAATKGIGGTMANIGSKALKFGSKIKPGWGMVAGLADIAGTSLGLWKEDSVVSKGLGVASDAATGAMIGSVIPVIGTAVGGLIGGAVGVVRHFGKDIVKGAKKAWNGLKKVGKGIANFFGFGADKEKEILENAKLPEFESKKFGETQIDDPQLFEKAALSVISIHDFLISKLGDKSNSAISEAKSKISSALGVIGSPFGGLGSAIGGIASGAVGVIGSLFGGGEKPETSTGNLKGQELIETAARATIDIKDTLNKIYIGGSILFSGSIFGRSSALKSRIPETGTGGFMSSFIESNMTPEPIGNNWFHKFVTPFAGGQLDVNSPSIGPIDVNVNGTIKLDLGDNNSISIDAKKLLENKVFVDALAERISDEFQRKVAMGAGANRSNPARWGIGNTDIIAGRRR